MCLIIHSSSHTIEAGVGNDFFPGGGPGGGFGPQAQGEYQGGGFWDPKIDQFWPKLQF